MSEYRTVTDLIISLLNSSGIEKVHDRERDVTKSKDAFREVLVVTDGEEQYVFCAFVIRTSTSTEYIEAANGVMYPVKTTWVYDVRVIRGFNEEKNSSDFMQELYEDLYDVFTDDSNIEAFKGIGFHINPIEVEAFDVVTYGDYTINEMRSKITVSKAI